MQRTELRATLTLGSLFAFRMMGLFMIFPVFALYAQGLAGSTPTLIGLALGIYGLTQGCLQIPFGMMSDKIGRKPVIAGGLVLFIIGSLIAACSHHLPGIILGRALQGCGAIGSSVLASVADHTEEDNRMKAMALIGMIIAVSFMIAMGLGPILNSLIGVPGIFGFTALLAAIGLIILFWLVPQAPQKIHHDSLVVGVQLRDILMNKDLLRLNLGIFILHAVLTASFFAIPLTLAHLAHLSPAHESIFYLPILIAAFGLALPLIVLSEAKRLLKPLFITSIILLCLTQWFMLFAQFHIWASALALTLFFIAFIFLEASLPSLVAKTAPLSKKGTAMGIYSSCQFFGIFVGGSLAGFIAHHFNLSMIFVFAALLASFWILIARRMPAPRYLSSKIIALPTQDETALQTLQSKLLALPGVAEVSLQADEGVAYLKVDKKLFDEASLKGLISTSI